MESTSDINYQTRVHSARPPGKAGSPEMMLKRLQEMIISLVRPCAFPCHLHALCVAHGAMTMQQC